jgi:hypothetical protein
MRADTIAATANPLAVILAGGHADLALTTTTANPS